jgi:hypothetical protein
MLFVISFRGVELVNLRSKYKAACLHGFLGIIPEGCL